MRPVGYKFLIDSMGLGGVLPPRASAVVAPVTRVQRAGNDGRDILVPAGVAPATDNPVEHVLFALKH